MLAYLRENTGNWIIKIFLGIIVIVFVFLGVGSFGSKQSDTIASIDDQDISFGEYQQAYKRIVDQLKIQFGNQLNDDILRALNVKQQALYSLIDSRVVLNQADEMGIEVSDRELQEIILSEKAFQVDGVFDLDQYKKVLRFQTMSPEMFEKMQVNEIRQAKVRQMVVNSVAVSDLEAKDLYLFENTQMAVNYIKVDPKQINGIEPNETAIKEFFDKNKANYRTQPQVKAKYLKFDPNDFKDAVNISGEQIAAYYQDNIKLFETPEEVSARHILIKTEADAEDKQINDALRKAKEIYEKAKNGDDFAELAKQFSEGPSSVQGGDLGRFSRQVMVKPFADKAFSMKAGEISEPVKTQFGWHIIKVEERFAASKKSLDSVTAQIKAELENQETQNLAYDLADEAFESVIDGDDFEQVARIVNKTPVSTAAFDRQGNGLDMMEKASFAEAAFALKQNDISDIKQLGNVYYLIQVIETVAPKDQALEVVKPLVVKDLTLQLQDLAAKKKAQNMIEKLTAGTEITAVAVEENLSVETTDMFTRNGSVKGIEANAAFVEAAFTLSPNNKTHDEVIQSGNVYYAIQFKELKSPDEADVQKNLAQVKDQLLRNKQAKALQDWLAKVKEQHKIVYDPNLIEL